MQEKVRSSEGEVKSARGLVDAANAARAEAEEKVARAQADYQRTYEKANPAINLPDAAALAAKAKGEPAPADEPEVAALSPPPAQKEKASGKGDSSRKKRSSASPARGSRRCAGLLLLATLRVVPRRHRGLAKSHVGQLIPPAAVHGPVHCLTSAAVLSPTA